MNSVNLNKVQPFAANLRITETTPQPTFAAKQNTQKLSDYSVYHVIANYAPTISFTGIHHDSVLGIETRVVGISQYQDNATRLKFRFINRNARGEKQKVHLRLEREKDNKKDPKAVAIYHDYDGKAMKLGYLSSPIADKVAPLMDKGFLFDAHVLNVAGGKNSEVPNVGVRIRLEYLSTPDRSPNKRKVDKVKKAFQQLMAKDQALSYREEKIYTSKTLKRATKLKVDDERNEATAYSKGWEQVHTEISDTPKIKNARVHPQDKKFTDHVANAVKFVHAKFQPKPQPKPQPNQPGEQLLLFPEDK
ncbi:MAG: HIRAN domain-containing protein [Candidatus Omnitrophota bacterium]